MMGLHHADALAMLSQLDDGACASVITDPPYSDHVHANGRRGDGDGSYGIERELHFEALDPRLRAACARQFARVANRWVCVFSDLEGARGWIDDLVIAGMDYVRTCIWHKPGSTPQFTGDRPASHAEAIVVAHAMRDGQRVRKRWNGGGSSNVFTFAPVRLQRCHTAQKPLPLMRRLVELFSDRGELVVDPFAGSGTTAVACKQLSRSFAGAERDKEVAKLARDRIRRTRADVFINRQPA